MWRREVIRLAVTDMRGSNTVDTKSYGGELILGGSMVVICSRTAHHRQTARIIAMMHSGEAGTWCASK